MEWKKRGSPGKGFLSLWTIFLLFSRGIPNKCILCGRCVRICDEVQGVGELSFTERGIKTSIDTDFHRPLECEFCGQCLDTCPVAAITSDCFRLLNQGLGIGGDDNALPLLRLRMSPHHRFEGRRGQACLLRSRRPDRVTVTSASKAALAGTSSTIRSGLKPLFSRSMEASERPPGRRRSGIVATGLETIKGPIGSGCHCRHCSPAG